jgi:hypothetical protein
VPASIVFLTKEYKHYKMQADWGHIISSRASWLQEPGAEKVLYFMVGRKQRERRELETRDNLQVAFPPPTMTYFLHLGSTS